jgi:hypothetical protein
MKHRPTRAPHRVCARQLLLLRAACGPLAEARGAWLAWREKVSPAEADAVEWPLLPWLSSRAGELGVSGDDRAVLDSMRRFVWMKNQSHVSVAAALCEELATIGLQPLFVKGLPLMLTRYRDTGRCRLSDVDWQLPVEQVEPAVRLLLRRGWLLEKNMVRNGQPVLDPREFAGVHAVHHVLRRDGEGTCCELHWNLLRFPLPEVDERPLFEAAQPLTVRGGSGLMPCPADLLLQVMVRGFSWDGAHRSLRWVVDACLLAGNEGTDWGRFAAEAERRGVVPLVQDAFVFLNDVAPGTIPESVCLRLASLPATPRSRAACLLLSRRWRALRPADLIPLARLLREGFVRRKRARVMLGYDANGARMLLRILGRSAGWKASNDSP